MEFKLQKQNVDNGITPNNPEKDIPTRPDKNPDQTIPRPGGNEPSKVDPTRIADPKKVDPTRIDSAPTKSHSHKWTKVNSWDEVLARMSI